LFLNEYHLEVMKRSSKSVVHVYIPNRERVTFQHSYYRNHIHYFFWVHMYTWRMIYLLELLS